MKKKNKKRKKERKRKERTEPCGWCGSTLGTTTEHDASIMSSGEFDGWPRCLNCGGN